MAEEGRLQGLAVQGRRLDVPRPLPGPFAHHPEDLAVFQQQLGLIEQGGAQGVLRLARAHGVEPQGGEHQPAGHGSPVLVAANACGGIGKPQVHQLPQVALGLPGGAVVIVQVGDVEGGLVPHGELAHQPGGVRELPQKQVLALPRLVEPLPEELVQLLHGLLFAAHELRQALRVVEHRPGVGPGVVLCGVVPAPQASAEFGIEPLHPGAVYGPGRHPPQVLPVKAAVALGPAVEQGRLLPAAQVLRQLAGAPVIVAVLQGDRHCLPPLKGVRLGIVLRLSPLQGGVIALFPVAPLLLPGGQAAPPGEHGLLQGVFPYALVGGGVVGFHPFRQGVGEQGRPVEADHKRPVPFHPGEAGHQPALPGHLHIALEDLPVAGRVQKKLQGVHAPEGVPQAVVAVEHPLVHLPVKAAVMGIPFRVVGHPLEGPVQPGVEHRLLLLGVSGDQHLPQLPVPDLPGLFPEGVEAFPGGLFQKALPGPLRGDQGETSGHGHSLAHRQGHLTLPLGHHLVRPLHGDAQELGHRPQCPLQGQLGEEQLPLPPDFPLGEGQPKPVLPLEPVDAAVRRHRGLRQDTIGVQLQPMDVAPGLLPAVVQIVCKAISLARRGDSLPQGEAHHPVVAVVVAAVPYHRSAAGHAVGQQHLGPGGGEHVRDRANIGVYIVR